MFARIQHVLAAVFFAAILGATFLAYLRPAFILDLANRIVLCM